MATNHRQGILVNWEGCVGLAQRGFMGEPLVGNKYAKPPK
jgi:hypothetical protein